MGLRSSAIVIATALILSTQISAPQAAVSASTVPTAQAYGYSALNLKLASYKRIDVGPVSMGTSMNCRGERKSVGDAWVTLAGDYVTVRDFCADGNPVKAVVSMKINGRVKYWSCYNTTGSGTTKECNFDWPEGYVGVKTVTFYAYPGIRDYKMGTLRHWRNG